uniref:TIR domain-containing protein n=1 Tax=Fagus sylvatica TaxID=28930 RepID=A0A2N9HKM0_FAGSY
MDYEGNTKKRKRSSSANFAGNTLSASAPASASGGQFEVFLSFRGKDTGKTFTDFLYTYLYEAGFRIFRDKEGLHVGEEIGPMLLKAINESKVSIPIFSRNYASSKWCLLELVEMVNCHETKGQLIFPIFYKVKPSDVRDQTGSYEKAFRKHQQHFDKKIVRRWKKALRVVGKMKGLELEETNGYEGELVKKVTSDVLSVLKKNNVVVTENLVGIDHDVEKIMGLVNVGSNDVHMVVIHGMAGIGKTTIAGVIYNKLSNSGCFECCCFLRNVRVMLQKDDDLLNLQKQLIKRIRKPNCCDDISNVDEGVNTIKDIVCKKKVLIVLDDVDENRKLGKIAGEHNWFGSGSRIIVTTRNPHALNLLSVDRTYELPLMEPGPSLQLFCKHAFKRSSPLEDYYILSKNVVSIAAGLPLALESIGSFLCNTERVVWEDKLKELKEIPHADVQESLRISYEGLNGSQESIFLDIACLFIGEDKRLPFCMWDDCKFVPSAGIEVLKRRSLVKIEDDKWLRMHDQLRDFGRQIVRKEKDQGKHSRLFIHKEASDVLKRQMGTDQVEAICVKADDRFEVFTDEEFRNLRNLRFLRVDNADLVGNFKDLLLNLKWLRWHNCPGNSRLTNFHLEKLVILDLSNNNYLKDNWKDWSQIKMAEKLKVLNLSRCEGLTRTPDFSTFTALEILILGMCQNLVEIDQSIWKLKTLRVLDISTDVSYLATPIRKFTPITKFPDAIGNLEKLEEINASHCFHLQEFPSSIGRLSSLRILRLDATGICSLPTSICELSLQTLDLYQCQKLQSLPKLPSSLTSLRVTCTSMRTFPSLSNLINLKELCFDVCVNLVKIPTDIGKLSKLETLTLSNCNKLVEFPSSIGGLSSLRILRLDTTGICSLPTGICELSSLQTLHLYRCSQLRSLPELPPSLTSLHVTCTSMETFPSLSKLIHLKKLSFEPGENLVEIPSDIGKLSKLETLYLWDTKICTLPEIGDLSLLMQLELHVCRNLQCIPRLPSSLIKLRLHKCKSVESLPDLSNLINLSELSLRVLPKLMEIQGLGKLESLMSLNISFCKSLERLPNVSNLGILKELKLCYCQKLAKVEGLGVLKSLETLDVTGCTSLERLDLSNLKNLKE